VNVIDLLLFDILCSYPMSLYFHFAVCCLLISTVTAVVLSFMFYEQLSVESL